MNYFLYDQSAIDYLTSKDKKLAEWMQSVGEIQREITPDIFTALILSIVSQQISTKAAETVGGRLRDRTEGLSAQNLVQIGKGEIQSCGMSYKKAENIFIIAQKVCDGELDCEALCHKSDEEVIEILDALPGVGIWTAEMLLIFSLNRMDVFSFGDLAIRRGLMGLYRHKELDKVRFERYRKRFSPYGSVASLYLWEKSHEMTSTMSKK